MEVNFENSEIQRIIYQEDGFIINTKKESNTILYKELLDIEHKEYESDEDFNSGVAGLLSSLIGVGLTGDATGLVAGPAGFGVLKFFYFVHDLFVDKKCSLVFKLALKKNIAFVGENDSYLQYREDIIEHYNKYFNKFLDIQNKIFENWKGTLQKYDKYLSLSETLSLAKNPSKIILSDDLRRSGCFYESTYKKVDTYFKNKYSFNSERISHNDDYILRNRGNHYLKTLIDSQKMSVLVDEDATLINAGAGSGKTTTILHKIIHLLEKKLCKSNEILILAYNNDVQKELKNKVKSIKNINIKDEIKELPENNIHTFHAFGRKQLKNKKVLESLKTVSKSEEEAEEKKVKIIDDIINILFNEEKFKKDLISYFSEYFFTYKDLFQDIETYSDYIKYIRNIKQKTLKGDWVRSFEEVEISNYLYLNGIKYEYEKKYEGKHDFKSLHNEVDNKTKNQQKVKELYKGEYHPDFYLTDYDIYLEHFALNKNNEAPSFFKNKDGYYQQYLKKKELHKINKTKLITTYSWQKQEGILATSLEKQLKKFSVKYKRLKDSEIMLKFIKTKKINNFSILISTFLSHYKSNELTTDDVKKKIILIKGSNNQKRAWIFIYLFKKIYDKYHQRLKDENSIDYDDMIIDGRKGIINEGYKYILVDEFQDISQARSKLLQKIQIENKAKLYCVGDDWQAIYQFAGGDISIFTKDFEKEYGAFERVDIDRTFRFGKKINLITSNFIQKNPNQLRKKIYSSNKSHDGLVVVYHYNKFSEVVKKIMQTEKQSKTYILGRYNLNHYDAQLKKNLPESDIITKEEVEKVLEKSKNFEYKTIHKSKGLEADNVIIINMFSGTNGFPSQKENDELLTLVLPNPENFTFAEERRLMYVAMTRAKKRIYMFTGDSIIAVSDFIEEIKKDYPKLINAFRKKKANEKRSHY
jgi:DNA helicase-4